MDYAITKSIAVTIEDDTDEGIEGVFDCDGYQDYLERKFSARYHGDDLPPGFLGDEFEDEDEEQEVFPEPVLSQNVVVYDEWADINELTKLEKGTAFLFHCDDNDIAEEIGQLEIEYEKYGIGKVSEMHNEGERDVDREWLMDRQDYEKDGPVMELKNFRLYEFYVMFVAMKEHSGLDKLAKKVWRTLRLCVRMGRSLWEYKDKTIARKSINYKFEQYINLISQFFSWRLVVSYPYFEHVSVGAANIISFGLKLPFIFKENSEICIAGMQFRVDFIEYMHKCSLTELLKIALVCRGWYMMVKRFVAPVIRYHEHVKSYGYGRGLYDNSHMECSEVQGRSALRARMGYADFFFDDSPNCVDLYNIGDDTIAYDEDVHDLERFYNTVIRVTDRTYRICKPYLMMRSKTLLYVLKYYPVMNEGACVILIGDVVDCEKSKEFWDLYAYYDDDYQFYLLRPFVMESFAHVMAKHDRWHALEFHE